MDRHSGSSAVVLVPFLSLRSWIRRVNNYLHLKSVRDVHHPWYIDSQRRLNPLRIGQDLDLMSSIARTRETWENCSSALEILVDIDIDEWVLDEVVDVEDFRNLDEPDILDLRDRSYYQHPVGLEVMEVGCLVGWGYSPESNSTAVGHLLEVRVDYNPTYQSVILNATPLLRILSLFDHHS